MSAPKFIPKELRQIEHLLHREEGEEFYWDGSVCDGSCCDDVTHSIELTDEPKDSTMDLLKDMATKYNLHIEIDGNTIWAAEKGINDV